MSARLQERIMPVLQSWLMGPFSYAEKVVDSGNSYSELKNLMNALYWYWNMGESLKKVS